MIHNISQLFVALFHLPCSSSKFASNPVWDSFSSFSPHIGLIDISIMISMGRLPNLNNNMVEVVKKVFSYLLSHINCHTEETSFFNLNRRTRLCEISAYLWSHYFRRKHVFHFQGAAAPSPGIIVEYYRV